jgi:hypothetical protein
MERFQIYSTADGMNAALLAVEAILATEGNTSSTNRPEPPCLLPEDQQARCGALPIGSLGGG